MPEPTAEELKESGMSEEEIEAMLEKDDDDVTPSDDKGDDEGKDDNKGDDIKKPDGDAAVGDDDDQKKDDEEDAKGDEKDKKGEGGDESEKDDGLGKKETDEKTDTPTRQTAPPYITKLSVNEEELKTAEDALADTQKKFNEGEVDFAALSKAQRDFDKLSWKKELATEINEGSRQSAWEHEQQLFLDENQQFRDNTSMNLLFVSTVNNLLADKDNAKLSDRDILDKAREIISKDLGGTPDADNDTNDNNNNTAKKKEKDRLLKDAKKAVSDKTKIPKTLKDLPNAEMEGGGKFEYLDNLSGNKYEEAISNMSDKEFEEYSKQQ